jgi:hypothetical protein
MSPRSYIRCVQYNFKPRVRSVHTVHLSYVKISTIFKYTKMSIHSSLVTKEYHRVRPKRFLSLWYVWCKLCTYLALTLTLSLNRLKRDSTWLTSPRRSIGCDQQRFLSVWYDRRKLRTYIVSKLALTPNGWNKHPLEPRHLGVPSGPSKMISELMVCLTQTVHLSCTETNTIFKWTEMRFHMAHITYVFYRVCPKWFLNLWYVWRKPCTCFASKLPLCPNRLKRAPTCASSPRSTTRCVQSDLWAYGMFGTDHAPILHWP